ncbi:TetR/AcrR family transcriptional regulator [Paenibacillus odorifer]|uniref:TetR family transcriptional regulator n=1 Tax=Paenibacillus odorifer TaxID=189426 RepID=A0A1R0Y4N7_9BACL|nr:TetR/AcrR family transcriptional regulator [Paenibacillus odorifer]OMD42279.1 TetR family transcriptional regulator [Paenibacillus odorifer]
MTHDLFDSLIAAQKTKTDKQKKIIEIAIKLFAEKGFANTSTAEIAKMANVSEGTIFKHYGTKDKLLLSIILPFVKDSLPSIANEVFSEVLTEDTKTFEQFLKGFLKNRIEFFDRNKEIFRVFVKEVIYKDELKKEIGPHFIKNISLLISQVVEEFKQRGELKDKPTDQVLIYLMTVCGSFFVSRFVLFENYSISDEEVENFVHFVMDGIRNPLSEASS